VLANGELVTANDKSNSDRMWSSSHLSTYSELFYPVFWALRGGGAGSWGVITSVTIKTYPTFNATLYEVILMIPSIKLVSDVMSAHAHYVFDWEPAGQYYELGTLPEGTFIAFSTYFLSTTAEEAITKMAPFFDEVLLLGMVVLSNATTTALANELVYNADDQVGGLAVIGSRLIPSAAYKDTPKVIGQAHEELVNSGF
jgi:hypothetical protein